MSRKIKNILHKYRSKGKLVADELLLKPNDALNLVFELRSSEVIILGVNLWYYTESGAIAEALESLDLSSLSLKQNASRLSIEETINFLTIHLPQHIEYISLVLDYVD